MLLSLSAKNIVQGSEFKRKLKPDIELIREFELEKWSVLREKCESLKELSIRNIDKIFFGEDHMPILLGNEIYEAPKWYLSWYSRQKIRSCFDKLLKQSSFSTIIEIGAGYGAKLLDIALYSRDVKKIVHDYIAIDISRSGLQLAEKLFANNSIELKSYAINYRNQNYIPEDIKTPALIISNYGIHYFTVFSNQEIEYWLNRGITAGIHIEPCNDMLNELKSPDDRTRTANYHIANSYTSNIATAFNIAQDRSLIRRSICKIPCGSINLPAWTINWNKEDL